MTNTRQLTLVLLIIGLVTAGVVLSWQWLQLDGEAAGLSAEIDPLEEEERVQVRRARKPEGIDSKRADAPETEVVTPKASQQNSELARVHVFFVDDSGVKRDVGKAAVTLIGEGQAKSGWLSWDDLRLTDSRGFATIPLAWNAPKRINVTAQGFMASQCQTQLGQVVEVELEKPRRTWISARMQRLNGDYVLGQRIQMSLPMSCDSFRNRLSVRIFEKREDVPALMIKDTKPQDHGIGYFHPYVNVRDPRLKQNGIEPKEVIGGIDASRRASWVVLYWESVPIQIGELAPNLAEVKFQFTEALVSKIDSLCRK